MDSIRILLDHYIIEVLLGIIIVLGIISIFITVLLLKTNKSIKRYNKLVGGIKNIEMEELLIAINKDLKATAIDIDKIEGDIADIRTKLDFAIQRVGFIRYNAFDDMGSQLSFSIALLDAFKNGFVLTSIYGREETVSYGKSIRNGQSKIPLSAEEMMAVDRAVKGSIEY